MSEFEARGSRAPPPGAPARRQAGRHHGCIKHHASGPRAVGTPQTFIRQIFARVAALAVAVPYRLLDEARAGPRRAPLCSLCAPLFRSAITFAARRALAAVASVGAPLPTAAEARPLRRRRTD